MSVQVTGKLFTGSSSKALLSAANKTKGKTLKVTRDFTRVRIVQRMGWKADISTGSSSVTLSFYNTTPYKPRSGNDYTPLMLVAAHGLQTAESLFQTELQKAVREELGGEVRVFANSKTGYEFVT